MEESMQGMMSDLTQVELKALRIIAEGCIARDTPVILVGAAELGRELAVSRTRAFHLLESLDEKAFLQKIPRKGHVLTQRGKDFVDVVQRKHRVIETYLVSVLGLSTEKACQFTQEFDVHVDESIIDSMCGALEHPSFCPHGQEIRHDADHISA